MELYLDTCAISYYCGMSVDLADLLSSEGFGIIITKGVIKELQDIPPTESAKSCVENVIAKYDFTEQSFFAFADTDDLASTARYVSGFNEGTMASQEQGDFLDQTKQKLGKELKSGLKRHETDRDLLALGLNNVIVTAENSVGKSLQSIAESQGTIVINVRKFNSPAELINHIKGLVNAAI